MSRPTREEIEYARTQAGGWTREQLREWGVPWPPPRGWLRALLHGERIPTVPRGALTKAQEDRVREIIEEMTGAVQ